MNNITLWHYQGLEITKINLKCVNTLTVRCCTYTLNNKSNLIPQFNHIHKQQKYIHRIIRKEKKRKREEVEKGLERQAHLRSACRKETT